MRITLDIPDGIICGFFNCVEHTNEGLQLVSYQLSSDDFTDGNTVKLPREQKEGADRAKNRAKTFPGIAKAMAEQWG